MPLVTSTEMLKKAYDGGYAVGAFNVNNMEIIQGITEAAMEEKSPLILQVSKGARSYANPVYLRKLVEAALEVTNLPICLHLDHGDSFETCKSCVDGGFSVMIDGSHLLLKKNVKVTKKVVSTPTTTAWWWKANWDGWPGVEDELKVKAEDSSYTQPAKCRSLSPDGRGLFSHRYRHQPRRVQIQGRAQAPLRHFGGDHPHPPRLPHRPRASSVIQEFVEQINQRRRPFGRTGRARGNAPSGSPERGAKSTSTDLRPAMTATLRKYLAENPPTLTPGSTSPRPARPSRRWCATRFLTVLGSNNRI